MAYLRALGHARSIVYWVARTTTVARLVAVRSSGGFDDLTDRKRHHEQAVMIAVTQGLSNVGIAVSLVKSVANVSHEN